MTGYIRGLDGLRAFAILWVMFGHVSWGSKFTATADYHKLIELAAKTGWIGVQLFFVISGFLITKILLQGKGRPNQLRHFYIRRSLRIFPVYYVTLILLFIVIPSLGYSLNWLSAETENQGWYWLYLNNWLRPYIDNKGFSHLWSLAIEEQYYLVWPFFVIFMNKQWLIRICLAMILSAPIIRFLLFYYFQTDVEGVGARAAYDFTFSRWDSIALGSLLAVLISNQSGIDWMKKYASKILIVSVVLTIVQLVLFRNFSAVGQGGVELLNQTVSAFTFFALVFIVASNNKAWYISLLEFTPVRLIGKYSYAMYIFHLPIMIVWFSYFVPNYEGVSEVGVLMQVLLNYLIVFTLTFTLAAVSWHVLEYPALKLKRRFQD